MNLFLAILNYIKKKNLIYDKLLPKVYGGIALQQLAAGNLIIFDGNPKTNQCHINALQTVLIYRKYQQEGLNALSLDNQKFLMICFFTNFEIAQARGDQVDPVRIKFFDTYFNLDVNKKTRNKYKELFLNSELKNLASQQLALMLFTLVNPGLNLDDCILDNRYPVPTYPKFLGAKIFLLLIKEQKISIELKVADYTRYFNHSPGPVIVIQAHAAGDREKIVKQIESYTEIEDFVLPCAAFFTASKQALFVNLVEKDRDFSTSLQKFKQLFAPLAIDIEHVHAEGQL